MHAHNPQQCSRLPPQPEPSCTGEKKRKAPPVATADAKRQRARRRKADAVLTAAVQQRRASAAPLDALGRSKLTQIVLTQPAGKGLSLAELEGDVLVALAERTWGPSAPKATKFQPALVERLYARELSGRGAGRGARVLELSQYLERYLWPHYAAGASDAHAMSIVRLVNEKFREGVPPWDSFVGGANPEKWPTFLQHALSLAPAAGLTLGGRPMTAPEATQYLRFTIHLFSSLEAAHVRDAVLRLASLPLWHALSPPRRELELFQQPALAKKWKALAKRDAKAAAAAAAEVRGSTTS